jgi:outer membrane protein assembly factor BamB
MGRRVLLGIAVTVAALGAAWTTQAAAAIPAWTTYRHDAARTGIDPDSTSPVTPSQSWQTPSLDGEVYGEPLVYGAYVYVATENDSIYKLDAATGAVVWSKHVATPEPSSLAPCGDISPSIGITGTPVIDPVAGRIYAVGAVLASGAVHHELFALDLGSGAKIAAYPVTVDPPFPAGGAAVNQLQRPGLALANGRVLIGYGGNAGDCKTYWGWIVSAPTDGTPPPPPFQVDPGSDRGAIWAGGNAPVVDSAGDVFVSTGNGTGTSSPDYGDSVVKLNPLALATPIDWWAPPNWQSLDSFDADLGSSMPTLLPGGFVFQSGKDGNGYVLNGADLGHVSPPVGEASGFCSGVSLGGSVYEPSTSTIYAACAGGLRALLFSAGSPPSAVAKPGFAAPSSATGPPMIAGGLVWVTSYLSGTLYGLDPATGAVKSHFSIPEHGPPVNHFSIPSAGGGRLFVASGDQVTAYTIARAPAPAATATTMASSANPAAAQSPVSLTATVAPAPDAGTVSFTDGGTPISTCAAIPVSAATAGRAVCHTTFTRSGTHNLSASYSGDGFYAASSSAVLVEIVGRLAGGRPRILHASISPHRFTARHRAKLRLTLSEAARLNVAITARRHGHRVTVRRLHFHGRAGRRTFKLSLRHLRPGHYAAYISAADSAGRRSQTRHVRFTIVAAM